MEREGKLLGTSLLQSVKGRGHPLWHCPSTAHRSAPTGEAHLHVTTRGRMPHGAGRVPRARCFRLECLLDAADMLTRESSCFFIDANVWIAFIDRDVPRQLMAT